MTDSKGSRVELAYIEEVTPGVTPAGTFKAIRKNSESIAANREALESGEIRDDRQTSSHIQGNTNVSGEITTELSPDSHDVLIESAFFSSFTTINSTGNLDLSMDDSDNSLNSSGLDLTTILVPGIFVSISGFTTAANNGFFKVVSVTSAKAVLANGTVVTEAAGDPIDITGKWMMAGSTPKYLSISKRYRDIGEHITFSGCLVAAMALNMTPSEIVGLAFTINGRDETVETAALPARADSVSVADPFDSFSGGVLIDNASDYCMTEASLALDNSIQDQFCIGRRGKSGQAEGRQMVTGSMSFYFSNLDLYEAAAANTDFAVDLVLSNADGSEQYALSMPRVKMNLNTPQAGDEGPITASGDFKALYDATVGGTLLISRTA